MTTTIPNKENVVLQVDLRDYFAGQALAGIAANSVYADRSSDYIARLSYEFADAMMKAREVKS